MSLRSADSGSCPTSAPPAELFESSRKKLSTWLSAPTLACCADFGAAASLPSCASRIGARGSSPGPRPEPAEAALGRTCAAVRERACALSCTMSTSARSSLDSTTSSSLLSISADWARLKHGTEDRFYSKRHVYDMRWRLEADVHMYMSVYILNG